MAPERIGRIALAGAVAVLIWCGRDATGIAQAPAASVAAPSAWAPFVEPDFPFFSSVLDARSLGPGWPADNLTPRGLVLNLGHGLWACFDTDLLRVPVIWSGAGVTPAGMAQGSYHHAGEKAPEGQSQLPAILGTPWIATGLYPGWHTVEPVALTDPREPGPDPREPGRGPIAPEAGRFRAIRVTTSGAVLEYEVGGVPVAEWIVGRATGRVAVERRIRVARRSAPLWLVVGQRPRGSVRTSVSVDGSPAVSLVERSDGVAVVRVAPAPGPIVFRVTVAPDGGEPPAESGSDTANPAPPPARWPDAVTTTASLATGGGAFVIDRIPIPAANPWRRNVRFADIAFTGPGRAALVTFDGDVWTASGLDGDLERIVWRRFTSGLHEPLGIAVRDGGLFVFDRNGLWRLEDEDGNGEADRHVLVSNVFGQTAETREFAMSLRIAPDGSFVIAKGGQVGATAGRDNGSVLRISRDGSSVVKLGWGFRQPFASVDPHSGRVVASDQQGHYIPSTPLHLVGGGAYYGFIPLTLPNEQYPAPIAEPIVWIPHAVSASAAGQVWLRGARMGPLDDALVLINYYRPGLLVVRMDQRAPGQAATAPLTRDFEFAPLAGAVNPGDGQLYVTGFRIWGSEARDISGLARYRYTGGPATLPREVVATDEGVLVRFDVALDQGAATPANLSAGRWNYRRTAAYGSPHFKLDGTRGQDTLTPSSVYLSADRRSLFVGLPGMQPVMQMRLGWSLRTAAGEAFDDSVYLTPRALARFDPVAEGFGPIDVDLAPRAARVAADVPATAEEGERIATRAGCLACHSTDGTITGRVGPSWKGLAGADRALVDGSRRIADAAYLRQAILEPAMHVPRGFDQPDAGMPSYEGVLTAAEIEALVIYIQSLK